MNFNNIDVMNELVNSMHACYVMFQFNCNLSLYSLSTENIILVAKLAEVNSSFARSLQQHSDAHLLRREKVDSTHYIGVMLYYVLYQLYFSITNMLQIIQGVHYMYGIYFFNL